MMRPLSAVPHRIRAALCPRSAAISLCFAALCFLCVSGCSLDYGSSSQAQIVSPEFVFYDAGFTHVERGKTKLRMEAEQIEQYTGADSLYGKNVSFAVYGDNSEPSLTGSCSLLSADRENKLYCFFSGIQIKSAEHRAEITADSLRWNEKTSVLDGGKDDTVNVSLETETGSRITIRGKAFSARKDDLSFAFGESVSGEIQ
ncbi:MAG: hypothetical protein ACFNOL_03525 [Treponema maltophilum]